MKYVTLAEPFEYEPERIKGSRFLAALAPAADAAAAEAFVKARRELYPGATHTCWAWRLGMHGSEQRSSDDGEPAGSAGRPILNQIEGHGVTHVVAAVTRWFGGTKLGVGGLVRAYGGTAGMALDRAPLLEHEVTEPLVLSFPYDCTSAVQACLHAQSLEPTESDYGAEVRLVLQVPVAVIETLRLELVERTAGRVRID